MLTITPCSKSIAQNKGLKTITEKELKYHLDFLGANEFRGRETPSPELEIATLYLGNWAEYTSLKPLLPDGSFYQTIPINVTSVKEPNTSLRVFTEKGESVYYYGESFGGSFYQTMSSNGEIVFAGMGLIDTKKDWDDLKGLDLFGKVVIIIDE